MFKQYNPCNIRLEKPTMFEPEVLMCKKFQYKNKRTVLCCRDCKHLRSTGCAVKCVACKTGFCESSLYEDSALDCFDECSKLLNVNSLAYKQLRKLHRIVHKYNFVQGGHKSKREVFRRLNSVSKSI